MKKGFTLSIPALLLFFMGLAQEPSYDVASIPQALKDNAPMIKRYENITFEVSDIDRASLNVHSVVTVMNEKGRRALTFYTHTSKFTSLEDAEVKLYDAKGKQIARYKKKDMTTQATGEGLIEDGKVTFIETSAPSYPVTIEIKYQERYKGTLFYPWYEIMQSGECIQSSTFTAKVPLNMEVRFKEKNISLKPETGGDDKYKWYKWSVKDLKTLDNEDGSDNKYPYIMMAPNRFKYDDYEGDLSSWKSFGQWYANLNKGLDVLPPDRVAFFKDLVKDAPNNREKIRIIYDYLQKNFRYVSIQLGIGGLRPFSADFTDKKKYGDCKALSNFTKAALSAVGINSIYAVINAGVNSPPMDADFPSKFSNHVILCVPMEKDSVWLECTSKTTDFAVLGSFTENRNALLITNEGGVLAPTPLSKSGDNKFEVTSNVTIQPDGSGKTVALFKTTGEYKEMMTAVMEEKKDDQKGYIIHGMGFKQPDEFTLNKKEANTTLVTELDMALEKVPEFIAGNKMFLSPRMYKLCNLRLPKAENRKSDFYFNIPYQKKDTTIIHLPEGFVIDALPQTKELKCPYASYQTRYWYDESKKSIYSTTTLALDQHKIPAAGYADVKKFFEQVMQDDAQRIVIKKQ
jgi:hypothetical protein